MSRTRIALIGAGALASRVHFPSLADLDEVDLVALCELDPRRLAAAAERFSIDKTFLDHRQMLEEVTPDAVYAIMPPHVLFDVAMDVLVAGHHLFIEKPPCLTTRQAAALARTAEQKGLVTGVGFQRRYHPLLQHCYRQICGKGQPHQVTASFFKFEPVGAVHPYYRGATDILTSDAIHAVDAVRFYCGLAEVRSVQSIVRKLDSWYDVSFNALLHF